MQVAQYPVVTAGDTNSHGHKGCKWGFGTAATTG
jgi:hypothetical protein